MALAASVTGDGNLVSYEKNERIYFVVTRAAKYKYTETKTVTIKEWTAVTEAAATTWVNAEPDEFESRRHRESSRIVGSYTAESVIEETTLTVEEVVDEEEA